MLIWVHLKSFYSTPYVAVYESQNFPSTLKCKDRKRSILSMHTLPEPNGLSLTPCGLMCCMPSKKRHLRVATKYEVAKALTVIAKYLFCLLLWSVVKQWPKYMAPDSNVHVNFSSILDALESGSRDNSDLSQENRHQRFFPKIPCSLHLPFQLENSFKKESFSIRKETKKKTTAK